MAITDKEKGVWSLEEVYNKINQGGIWDYDGTPAERTNLYVWGANNNGTLGQNAQGGWSEYLTAQSSPIQIPGTWSSFSTGSSISAGVKANGTLWTWGGNNYGELAQNDATYGYSSPTQVGTDTDWSITIGSRQDFYAVKTNGTLWVSGRNENGKLGLNAPQTSNKSSPTQVPGTWSTNSRKFRSSNYHTIAIKDNGTLWSWGTNQYGTLGLNSSGGSGSSADRFSSPVQIGTETTWSSCIAGYYWSAATKTNGTMWSWGLNQAGSLGQNSADVKLSSPTQIGTDTTWSKVLGGYHNLFAIKTDGTLWSWGSDTYGALGQNSRNNYKSSPTQVGTDTTWEDLTGSTSFMATKTDGTLWVWGDNQAGQNAQNDRGGYDGLWGPLLARSSPTQVPGGWKIDKVNMSGGPGGRQMGAFKA